MKTRPLLTSLLAIAIPATNLFADSAATMVYAVGNVTVNGGVITRSAAVFDGDLIATGEGGMTMTRTGSTIVVPGNSRVLLRGNNLELGCGGAMVKTMSGMSTIVQGYKISPVTQNGRYRIVENANQLQVASIEGQLAIFDGKQSIALAAGHSLDLPGQCMASAALKDTSLSVTSPRAIAGGDSVGLSAAALPQNQGGTPGAGGATGGGAASGAGTGASVSTLTSIGVSFGAMGVGIGTSLASTSNAPVASATAP